VSKRIQFGEAKQKELDNVVRKLAQGHKAAVEAELERRLSYQDEGKVRYQAYARFLLSDGHVVFVNLRTMEGSVSAKPNMRAKGKVERREKAIAKREEKKAQAEAKAAQVKANKVLAEVQAAGEKAKRTVKQTVHA
jgi:hypothetical protein